MNVIWEYQYEGTWTEFPPDQQVIINSAVEQGHTDAYIEDNNSLYVIDTQTKTATCGSLIMPIRSTNGYDGIWMWQNDDNQLYPFDTPIQKELENHYNRQDTDYNLIIDDMTQTNLDSGKVRRIHRIT